MRSVITMAKDIGMKTLAEGVETQEQFDFLKECGCGMIQGYYYGKPEPVADMFRHISERGIEIELRKWRHFYETAGFYAQPTDSPLEIIEDDGTNFRTLFMNNSYKKQISLENIKTEEIDEKIYHTASPLLVKYRDFANRIEESGKEETFYYPSNGMYLRLIAKAVAECEGHYIIKGEITNISRDDQKLENERLDAKARQLNLLFESVLLVMIRENTVKPVFGGFKYLKYLSTIDNDLQNSIKVIENEIVHPTERARCHAFLLSADLKERVEKTGCGYITDIFRMKQSDGNYRWKEIFIMMIPGTEGNEYLYCMKNYTSLSEADNNASDNDRDPNPADNTSLPNDNGHIARRSGILGIGKSIELFAEHCDNLDVTNIWQNLMWNTSLKVFWKDKEFKFIGISKSFLDYFGFESDEQVIGKTDDELKIHVNNESFNAIERDVIGSGRKFYNVHGQCLVSGMVHEIFYDIIPLYHNEMIVGCIGVFRDSEEVRKMIDMQISEMKKDPVTGLMNTHAFVDSLIDYSIKSNEDGIDYGLIVLNNLRYDRIISTYNTDVGNKVLKCIADKITESVDKNCILARPKESIFVILTRVENADEFRKLAEKVEENVKTINEVDGYSITMKIKVACKVRSESNVADEKFYAKVLKEVLK